MDQLSDTKRTAWRALWHRLHAEMSCKFIKMSFEMSFLALGNYIH